jgi:uncharacterized protein (TIGR00369 family)
MRTAAEFNALGRGKLPGKLGIVITRIDADGVLAELAIDESLMAPNDFLHAGAIVTLADTCCGYGCIEKLPEGAVGFTTIELKSNHLGTAREGVIDCTATALHVGRTTHVWDAVVTHRGTKRTLALFRCTQMILYPRG